MKIFYHYYIFLFLFVLLSCKKDIDKIDQQVIEKYILDNNLTTESTSSGLHYIINNQGSGTAYMNTKENLRAKHTNRQNTSVHYVGDAKGDDKGGYLVKKIVPKNTSRQYYCS